MPDRNPLTFLGLPARTLDTLSNEQIAILGIPDATPYEPGKRSHSADAPTAIREAVARHGNWTEHFDFDLGTPLIADDWPPIADLGDLDCDPSDPAGNRARITGTINRLLDADSLPVILGGDDSVPIPVIAAYEGRGPIWIVQVDAHMDWRRERNGEALGWSSPMRRASEMNWVEGIVQIGIRGIGSARPEDVSDAREWGARIFTAQDVQRAGIDQAISAVPKDAKVFITIDCDGLDPAVMPAVMAQAPGGLSYWQTVELIHGLARRAQIVGFDLVELAPAREVNGLGALTAGRIICNVIGAVNKNRNA